MLALSGSARSNDAVRVEKSVTSFRDTLDSASRSPAKSSRESSYEPARSSDTRDYATKDRSDARDDHTTDERGDDDKSARRESEASSTADQTVGNDLSLVLAVLGGAGATAESGAEFDKALVGLQSAVADKALIGEAGDVLEQGPVLPGDLPKAGEAFDAAKLLALLKNAPDTSLTPQGDVAADAGAFTATVLGQETHLAVEMQIQTTAQQSAEVQEAGAVNGAQLAAKAAGGALDASEQTRGGRLANDAVPQDSEPGATRRGGAPTLDTRSSVGGAFGDQGIAGQDSRQQEGSSGSSSGNSQQSSTGVFASMVNEARNQGVRPAEDGELAVFDPLSEQIAAEVRAELRADGMGESSSDGVVKVLHLQLKPANLGAVTVRLALRDNVISIHMEAQHRDTVAVIEREREALAGALASAGYSVDGISAAPQGDITRTSSSSQTGFGDQGAARSQGQGNQGQGLANSSGEQGRQGRGSFGGEAYSTASGGKDVSGNGGRGTADGLYV
jgi:hypothetical protein